MENTVLTESSESSPRMENQKSFNINDEIKEDEDTNSDVFTTHKYCEQNHKSSHYRQSSSNFETFKINNNDHSRITRKGRKTISKYNIENDSDFTLSPLNLKTPSTRTENEKVHKFIEHHQVQNTSSSSSNDYYASPPDSKIPKTELLAPFNSKKSRKPIMNKKNISRNFENLEPNQEQSSSSKLNMPHSKNSKKQQHRRRVNRLSTRDANTCYQQKLAEKTCDKCDQSIDDIDNLSNTIINESAMNTSLISSDSNFSVNRQQNQNQLIRQNQNQNTHIYFRSEDSDFEDKGLLEDEISNSRNSRCYYHRTAYSNNENEIDHTALINSKNHRRRDQEKKLSDLPNDVLRIIACKLDAKDYAFG